MRQDENRQRDLRTFVDTDYLRYMKNICAFEKICEH